MRNKKIIVFVQFGNSGHELFTIRWIILGIIASAWPPWKFQRSLNRMKISGVNYMAMLNTFSKSEMKTNSFCVSSVPSKSLQECGDFGFSLAFTVKHPRPWFAFHVLKKVLQTTFQGNFGSGDTNNILSEIPSLAIQSTDRCANTGLK